MISVRPDTPSVVVLEAKIDRSSEVSSEPNPALFVAKKRSKYTGSNIQSRGTVGAFDESHLETLKQSINPH